MADGTKIEWTDATWNPITGCSVISAGCKHCYAMKLAGTRMKHHPSRAGLTVDTKAGPVWNGEVRFNDSWLLQPLGWTKPREIFVNAHGDTFHEAVPDEWLDMLFAVMALAPQHRFQVLTKRSDRMLAYMSDTSTARNDGRGAALMSIWDRIGTPHHLRVMEGFSWPLPNVWMGVSVEDQAAADLRVPHLLATPAAVRWISAEPLLGPVDLTNITGAEKSREYGSPVHGWSAIWKNNGLGRPCLDWVVVGGESDKGPNARPMHPDWARQLRDQCAAAGVAFLFKQWGDWVEIDGPKTKGKGPVSRQAKEYPLAYIMPDGVVVTKDHPRWRTVSVWGEYLMARTGKSIAGRSLDGVTHDGMPQ